PHATLLKLPNEAQGFYMAARLHSAAENGEDFSLRRCEQFRRRGRYSGGSHLRDQPSVHYREWCSRLWIDKKNRGHVCRDSALRVRRVERYCFQSESIRREGGH